MVVAPGKVAVAPTTDGRTSMVVCPTIVVGIMVVPGMVMVNVSTSPSPPAGMGVPTPADVYGVGKFSVAVFGDAAGSAE